jgi:hypothetical protein
MLLIRTEALSQLVTINSPDGRIAAIVYTQNGSLFYDASIDGKKVLLPSKLGLIREDENFSVNMKVVKISTVTEVKDNYEMLTAKRRNIRYRAKKCILSLVSAGGQKMDIIFQVSNDGVAFRYYFPGKSAKFYRVSQEITSFNVGKAARTWLQPKAEAQSGWEHVNPCYEENYIMDQPAGVKSPSTNGFVFPALFQNNDTWMLITEAALDTGYCGSSLRQQAPNGEYSIGFPHPTENMERGDVDPHTTLPWYTPWRIITIGELSTIIESTLGTDLAKPAPIMPSNLYRPYAPGKASWSWAIRHDEAITYHESKQFIDYSADMKWQYTLIDVNWDTRIGYDSMKLLCNYAAGKNVGVLLWYNSAGDWNTTPYHPRNKMLTHESRMKEFKRIAAMGVKGVKIDFFAGDGTSMIRYYHAILKDAQLFGLLVNFHGATIPRGWHRTFPNLMTMEAVKGFEMITFSQKTADEAPAHCAMLPFTRNAFDPMDFTPMSFDTIPRIKRKTTISYELALSVLFISGIQHYAERPEGMAKVPSYVKTFLQELPVVWEDVKFIDGFPGKYVALARQGKNKWYVAGVNGESDHRKIEIDLSSYKASKATLITDDPTNRSFKQESITPSGFVEIDMQPYGGFVMLLE